MTAVLEIVRDPVDGHLRARAPALFRALADWLESDVQEDPAHARLLLEQVRGEADGEHVGNAYVLVLNGTEARIEALHDPDERLALPRRDLAGALQGWLAALDRRA
ncbi:hypothetical protein [Oceanibacterium hippocampi]|uniref:Uncharacterized protein n=1 Tax=Oceanibacterium hippocampi TaxID=745714 RepID=A0A1Y5TY73_9PROT|nr:hypothetical protein [Oceanibacterium hippocampi]SLN76779.1 hypothetical protein OCH7691_04188 [Oceanibacterium hippocampi]